MRPTSAAGWWTLDVDGTTFLALAGGGAADELRTIEALRHAGCPLLPEPASNGTDPSPGAGPGERLHWFRAPAGWPADAPQSQVRIEDTVAGLAAALRSLHAVSVPAGWSPLDAASLVQRVADRVAGGAVDGSGLDPARARLTPQDVVEQLRDLVPLLDARAARRPVHAVVTHGSARPSAVWLDRGIPTGMIGWAEASVCDPYRDLGALARRLARAYGAEVLPPFFAAYGLAEPDPIRLEFHALLDELR